MQNNDLDIVAACQSGKTKQFTHLYDKYIEKIYKFIYFKTHHKETAEDLTSQTFIKALKKIDSFNCNSGGTFTGWLYQIARNTVIDFYRTQRLGYNIDDIWDLSEKEDIDKDIDIKEQLTKVEKYLKKLGSHQREIVILRVWESMSYAEIAEIVDKSEVNCRMIFSRTIKVLRTKMPLGLFFCVTNLLVNRII